MRPSWNTEGNRYRNYAIILVAVMTVYHLLVIGAVGPGDNEAYYWTWSQHLDLSYFDHPPMVAYMIALTTAVGGDSPFFLRIGTALFFIVSSLFVYRLAGEISGSQRIAFHSLFLASITPLFFLAGILSVPDAPLAAFWLIYLTLLYRVIHGVPRRHWYLMGLVLGLAVLSKYSAVLLVPSTLLFFLSDRKLREHLKTPHPYLALVLAAAVASPVLLWNIRENWASFAFHLSARHEGGFSWSNVWSLLLGQLGVVTPVLLILSFAALFIFIKRGWKTRGDIRNKFILCASVPTLLFFYTVMCLTNDAEPHWPGLGYMPLLIGAAWLYPEYLIKKRNLNLRNIRRRISALAFLRMWLKGPLAFRLLAALALAVPLVSVIALNVQLLYPVYRPAAAKIESADNLTGWELGRYDATSDLFGWEEVGKRVRELSREMAEESSPPFIFSSHYNPASQLSFALKDTDNVYCLSKAIDQFDFWQDTGKLAGRNAVYVITNRYNLAPHEVFAFERVEGPDTIETFRAGDYKVRETYIFRCYGLKRWK